MDPISDRYPPGPRYRTPFGALLAMQGDRPGYLTALAREYGDLVHIRLGLRHLYLLNHPDLIREMLITHQRHLIKGRGLQRSKWLLGEGLLTSEGEFHLRQRRLIQPLFHRQRIADYGDVMVASAERVAGGWQAGEELDVSREMMRLTLAIVARTLFRTEVEEEAEEIGRTIDMLLGRFNQQLLPGAELLERLPLPSNRRYHEARALLERTIQRMIAERRATGDRGDLLSMLLAAQDVEGDGGGMSDRQIRDEALTIFLAGHETTANALTWSWYLLSQSPEVEARLHEEVDRVLEEGRLPAAEDLERLPYTRMVLAESMRLYPPAWIIARQAKLPIRLGGYVLPAGATLLASQWITHRDARFFPDPLRFDPERWAPGKGSERPRFAYFPFGGGNRICIGEQFAWMEGILVIATIARHWRLRLVPGHPVDIGAQITLRPRYGMKMVPERREALRPDRAATAPEARSPRAAKSAPER